MGKGTPEAAPHALGRIRNASPALRRGAHTLHEGVQATCRMIPPDGDIRPSAEPRSSCPVQRTQHCTARRHGLQCVSGTEPENMQAILVTADADERDILTFVLRHAGLAVSASIDLEHVTPTCLYPPAALVTPQLFPVSAPFSPLPHN